MVCKGLVRVMSEFDEIEFVEEVPAEHGFSAQWTRNVAPYLEAYRNDFNRAMKLALIGVLWAIVIGGGAWLYYSMTGGGWSEQNLSKFGIAAFFIAILPMLGLMIPYSRLSNDMEGRVRAAVEAHFSMIMKPDENYSFADGMARELSWAGFADGSLQGISDHYSGAYRGCRLRAFTAEFRTMGAAQAATRVERARSFSGRTQIHTKHQIIRVSVPEEFVGEIRIEADKGVVGNRLNAAMTDMGRYEVPHAAFERIFEVYADDAVSAAKIMTAEFAENLLAIHQQYARKMLGKTRLSGQFLDGNFTMVIEDAGGMGVARLGDDAPEKIVDMARNMIASFATIPYVIDYLHGDRPHK